MNISGYHPFTGGLKPFSPGALAASAPPIAKVKGVAFKSTAKLAASLATLKKEYATSQASKRQIQALASAPKAQKRTESDDDYRDDDSTSSDSASKISTVKKQEPKVASDVEMEEAPNLVALAQQMNQSINELYTAQGKGVRNVKDRLKVQGSRLTQMVASAPPISNELKATMQLLFDQRVEKNLVFLVEKTRVAAHKPVLDASEFADYFARITVNNQGEAIPIEGCRHLIFNAFLRYVYTHEINFSEVSSIEMLDFVQKENFVSLKKLCEEHIKKLALTEKAFELSQISRDSIYYEVFKEELLKCPMALIPALSDISFDLMIEFLSDDRLNLVNEIEIFDLISAWINFNRATSEQKEQLYSQARIGLLTYEEIFSVIAKLDIYSYEQLGEFGIRKAKPSGPDDKFSRPRTAHSPARPLEGFTPFFEAKTAGGNVILSGSISTYPNSFEFKTPHNTPATLNITREEGGRITMTMVNRQEAKMACGYKVYFITYNPDTASIGLKTATGQHIDESAVVLPSKTPGISFAISFEK